MATLTMQNNEVPSMASPRAKKGEMLSKAILLATNAHARL